MVRLDLDGDLSGFIADWDSTSLDKSVRVVLHFHAPENLGIVRRKYDWCEYIEW